MEAVVVEPDVEGSPATTSQRISPGTRLTSTACSAQVVVVRAPSTPVGVTCAGQPMEPMRTPRAAGGPSDGVLLGKRYVDEPSGVELLCTRGGAGPLAVDGRELTVKTAKPLPASD